MADRELQTILNSGEITQAYFGGVTSSKKVVIQEDIQLSLVALAASTSLTSQAIVANTPEKYTWYDTAVVDQGSHVGYTLADQEINIISSGTYKVMGTQQFEFQNGSIVEFTMYVNGVASSFKNSGIGKGSGNSVGVTFIGAATFNAGDTITIYVEGNSTGNITCMGSNVLVEKIS